MRISEFTGKEVINLGDGARLGIINECELSIDSQTGQILGIILPKRKNLLNFLADLQSTVVPWQAIKRIGEEVIIVDLNNSYESYERILG
ncbi:MAG TPA: YlmC/YmxH family sporulation protein [Methylomusa anaerophila]|uniref:PRC-barrel domain protein n=1 Tax=Methylomusa anaerophila TaxID=1930071 RepID=A0A348APX7_9FIRM|nr:YlmC/YmxH family sporulation protein [Methylomusa anaerophila]BBB93125.1 PRC-barrel domain protein [Methylomusa anaerophila]HML87042.1 YlmC/YmxH family sporulation protein [Methylomusa anaerophila]